MSECVKVMVRVRPMNKSEKARGKFKNRKKLYCYRLQGNCKVRLVNKVPWNHKWNKWKLDSKVIQLWSSLWCRLNPVCSLRRMRLQLGRVCAARLQRYHLCVRVDRLRQNPHDDGGAWWPRTPWYYSELFRPHFRLPQRRLDGGQKIPNQVQLSRDLQRGGVRSAYRHEEERTTNQARN